VFPRSGDESAVTRIGMRTPRRSLTHGGAVRVARIERMHDRRSHAWCGRIPLRAP